MNSDALCLMFILQNCRNSVYFKATVFQYEIAHYVYGASRSCVLIYNVRNQIQTYMVIACAFMFSLLLFVFAFCVAFEIQIIYK